MESDLVAPSSPEVQPQPCPHCEALIDVSDQEPLTDIACPNCGTAMTVQGTISHFDLVEVAGRGGMGVVYKAYDSSLDRNVALKLLRKDHSDNSALIAQLETEAAITASINHPHVVKVFSTGTDRGRFFLAMELVDKGSLDDLMRIQGRVVELQALEVGIHIAKGLQAAFQHGLIHRDVKPGNILFADAHTAKIVDFGLAIFMEQEESVRGEIWGTPYYVAPEKLDGKPEDFRSDIYSLGATLFHAMAGRPPFEAESASLVALKHLKSQPVSLQSFAPHVSGRTAFIVNRTLLKDPEARYQSYEELIEHLEYAHEELLQGAGKAPQVKRVVLETAQDQKIWGWVTLSMVGLLLVGALVVFFFRVQIFGESDANNPGTAAISGELPTGPASELQKARAKLLNAHPADAAADFRSLAAKGQLSPVEVGWAKLQEGLAELQSGQLPAAQTAFKALGAHGTVLGKDAATRESGALFEKIAARMTAEGPVEPSSLKDVAQTGPETILLLLAGLKDWQLGQPEEAAVLLKRFRGAAPTGEHAWIATLKPLVAQPIEDITKFHMTVEQLKAAKSSGEQATAAATLRSFSGPLASAAKDLVKDIVPIVKVPNVSYALGDWTYSDVGSTKPEGKTVFDAKTGIFTITGSGADIWTTEDAFQFVFQKMRGNFALVAKLTGLAKTNQYVKAGVSIRESLSPDSVNATIAMSPERGAFQRRVGTGKLTTESKVDRTTLPHWVKIVRTGNSIAGFHSVDGNSWELMGTENFADLPAEIYAGLAVCSHNVGTLTTATFEAVKFSKQP